MYNPSDLNTKKLSQAHRELLMSIIGVTDDREVFEVYATHAENQWFKS